MDLTNNEAFLQKVYQMKQLFTLLRYF